MTCKVSPLMVLFCCHGNVKFEQQYELLLLVCVKQVLNCKYAHLIFYHEKKTALKMVCYVYLRQFDGVFAMAT